MVAEAAQHLGGVHILVNSGSAPGGSATATGPSSQLSTRTCWRISTEVCRSPAMFPCRHSFHEAGGLGPYHQHQRRQCPQRRQPQRRSAQRRHGAHDEDAGGATGPARDHGQLHPSRHDPHRTNAEPARGPRHAARRIAEEAERQDFDPIGRAAMPSAAWSTPRRSRSLQFSWPPTRLGQSPANRLWRPEEPAGRLSLTIPFAWRAVVPVPNPEEGPMARIPLVTRDAVPPAEQAAYDAFSRRAGGASRRSGPIRSSRTCRRWRNGWKRSRTYIRKEAGSLKPWQEIVTLTVAREMNCASFCMLRGRRPAGRRARRDRG